MATKQSAAIAIYHYSPTTGELLGGSMSGVDPLDGLPLIPAYATTVAPPTATTGKVAVFAPATASWSKQPDYRGVIYDTSTGAALRWDKTGALPAGKTNIAPPSDLYRWDDATGQWTTTLARVQAVAVAAINHAAGQARARHITITPGQASVYALKAAEADAYVAAGRPADTTPYPILAAEAQARAMTISALADEVRSTRDNWIVISAQTEAARMKGKTEVASCTAADPTALTSVEVQSITNAQIAAEAALAAI